MQQLLTKSILKRYFTVTETNGMGGGRRENKKINQRIRVGRIGNDFRVARRCGGFDVSYGFVCTSI